MNVGAFQLDNSLFGVVGSSSQPRSGFPVILEPVRRPIAPSAPSSHAATQAAHPAAHGSTTAAPETKSHHAAHHASLPPSFQLSLVRIRSSANDTGRRDSAKSTARTVVVSGRSCCLSCLSPPLACAEPQACCVSVRVAAGPGHPPPRRLRMDAGHARPRRLPPHGPRRSVLPVLAAVLSALLMAVCCAGTSAVSSWLGSHRLAPPALHARSESWLHAPATRSLPPPLLPLSSLLPAHLCRPDDERHKVYFQRLVLPPVQLNLSLNLGLGHGAGQSGQGLAQPQPGQREQELLAEADAALLGARWHAHTNGGFGSLQPMPVRLLLLVFLSHHCGWSLQKWGLLHSQSPHSNRQLLLRRLLSALGPHKDEVSAAPYHASQS